MAGGEFAHIHPDGSLHAPLPVERAVEAVENGWAELHPWADREAFPDGFVLLFTPQAADELEVTLQLVVESYNHVTGRAVAVSQLDWPGKLPRAMDLSHFERYPLTFGPTPIERWDRLGEQLDAGIEIWAKREDCNSGLAFGGNKLRKLEYLVPDAIARGCDTLVSVGAVQSNHTRQVAAVAAKIGMKCHLVQGAWVEMSGDVYERAGNIQLSRLMGAETQLTSDPFDIGLQRGWQQALDAVRDAGGKPYAIPAGASDHPLGGLGYAGFAQEVLEQERELGFSFDAVIVASATASTQAGMIAGFLDEDRASTVIGIDTTARPDDTRIMLKKIAEQTIEQIGATRPVEDSDVVLLEDYAGPDYGLASEDTLEAIRTLARCEGVITDPVYEGKSLHGLIDLARGGRFPAGSRVLYAHLGGAPVLGAYSEEF